MCVCACVCVCASVCECTCSVSALTKMRSSSACKITNVFFEFFSRTLEAITDQAWRSEATYAAGPAQGKESPAAKQGSNSRLAQVNARTYRWMLELRETN